MSLSKVAIIGTGMTALSIGYYLPLVNPLVQITFFDKGQKAGGRVATRRSRQNPQLLFDHGAPYLQPNHISGDFKNILSDLDITKQISLNFTKANSQNNNIQTNIISKNVIVGKNGLDSIPESIFKSLKNVKKSYFQHRIIQISQNTQKQLVFKYQQNPKVQVNKQLNSFNQVFCCVPFPQAKSIKQQILSFQPYNKIQQNYNANWIILTSTKKGELFPEFKNIDVIDFTSIKKSPIKYAVKQNKKFQKLNNSDTQNWVLYFSDQWTQQHLNLSKDQVQQVFMKQILLQHSNDKNIKPSFITVHRWLYSSPKKSQQIKSALISQNKKLIFVGDWVGNKQYIGQCWSLGKQIVQEVYNKTIKPFSPNNKSKL